MKPSGRLDRNLSVSALGLSVSRSSIPRAVSEAEAGLSLSHPRPIPRVPRYLSSDCDTEESVRHVVERVPHFQHLIPRGPRYLFSVSDKRAGALYMWSRRSVSESSGGARAKTNTNTFRMPSLRTL